MSLAQRLLDLTAAIGADIKALKSGTASARYNAGIASQTINGVQAYVTGSAVDIPANSLQVGSTYRMRCHLTKTAAGTAVPVVSLFIGTTGSLSDTARIGQNFLAQTAVADEGVLDIEVVFRAVGASAVVQQIGLLTHRAVSVGLSNSTSSVHATTSAAFDVTTATKIGVAINPGASAVWTISEVSAELKNIQQVNPAGILFVNALSEVPAGTPANTLVVLKGA